MAEASQHWLNERQLRVMTYKSGALTFRVGADLSQLQPMLDRINDAQHRFNQIPGLNQIVDDMQSRVLATSVYSTNTIEGGQFSPQETAQILRRDPATIQRAEERRLTNLKAAIESIKSQACPELRPEQGQPLQLAQIIHLHRLVSQNIDEAHNPPGVLRNNRAGQKTLVGDNAHGGTYRPPKTQIDIELLLDGLLSWLNAPAIMSLPVPLRAALAHYYVELIHPFWDGNGRTGRLIEMLILEQSGYTYSSSAIWQFYQENLHQYFTLFNHCRKQAEKKHPFPNQDFLHFSLQGLFTTINRLHDESNELIRALLFHSHLTSARLNHVLSERQYQLVILYMQWLSHNSPLTPTELYVTPAVQALYHHRTERTFHRDVADMKSRHFFREQQGKLFL